MCEYLQRLQGKEAVLKYAHGGGPLSAKPDKYLADMFCILAVISTFVLQKLYKLLSVLALTLVYVAATMDFTNFGIFYLKARDVQRSQSILNLGYTLNHIIRPVIKVVL